MPLLATPMRRLLLTLSLAACTSSHPPALDSGSPDAGPMPLLDASLHPLQEGPPDFTHTLGSFDTGYESGGNRGKNVRLAASRVNETVVPPKGIFSFNATVGPRTAARGFLEAGVIFKGEMTHGMGGGVCQVSSTLHATALMAGLDVIERIPHSRPSAYIPMGLDSTVTIAEECETAPRSKDCYIADLRIQNPYSFPVLLVLESRPGKRKGLAILHGEVLGAADLLGRAYSFIVKDVKPFEKRVRESEDAGVPTCVQKGLVRRTVMGKILAKSPTGGENLVRTFEVKYPPTDEIWEIPVGFQADPSDAGTLPDGFPPT